jgi:KUP system potassium uptake protein
MGAVSCIIWTLALIPLVKYSWLVLHASDELGEGISFPQFNTGGTLVLYKLLSRSLEFEKTTPQTSDTIFLNHPEATEEILEENWEVKAPLHTGRKVLRLCLLIWTLFGASCVMADGLLTPAVSVISAVSGTPINRLSNAGLAVRAPVLTPAILPLAILIILFIVCAPLFC